MKAIQDTSAGHRVMKIGEGTTFLPGVLLSQRFELLQTANRSYPNPIDEWPINHSHVCHS
jgi:hypothetical protein